MNWIEKLQDWLLEAPPFALPEVDLTIDNGPPFVKDISSISSAATASALPFIVSSKKLAWTTGVFATIISFTIFFIINRISRRLFPTTSLSSVISPSTPSSSFTSSSHVKGITSSHSEKESYNEWRFHNMKVSLIHSFLSGSWCLFLITTNYRAIFQDLVVYFDVSMYALSATSLGYFLFDLFDIVISRQSRNHWELVIHHVVICILVWWHMYAGLCLAWTTIGLLPEVSNVLLHSRKLWHLAKSKTSRQTTLYKVLIVANIISLVIFRMGANFIIIYGIWFYHFIHGRFGPLYLFIGIFFAAVMSVLNFVLLWRLLNTDFIRSTTAATAASTSSSSSPRSNTEGQSSSQDASISALAPLPVTQEQASSPSSCSSNRRKTELLLDVTDKDNVITAPVAAASLLSLSPSKRQPHHRRKR